MHSRAVAARTDHDASTQRPRPSGGVFISAARDFPVRQETNLGNVRSSQVRKSASGRLQPFTSVRDRPKPDIDEPAIAVTIDGRSSVTSISPPTIFVAWRSDVLRECAFAEHGRAPCALKGLHTSFVTPIAKGSDRWHGAHSLALVLDDGAHRAPCPCLADFVARLLTPASAEARAVSAGRACTSHPWPASRAFHPTTYQTGHEACSPPPR